MNCHPGWQFNWQNFVLEFRPQFMPQFVPELLMQNYYKKVSKMLLHTGVLFKKASWAQTGAKTRAQNFVS